MTGAGANLRVVERIESTSSTQAAASGSQLAEGRAGLELTGKVRCLDRSDFDEYGRPGK
jgi:hypothetical protein